MAVLELPDLRLSYQRAGSGLPLVLLHGWPEWSGIWRHNLPALAENFGVVAPDLRNFGASVGAPARDVDHYVADLAALVDDLGFERFGLVSHDVGAFLAQDYARANPHRLARLFFSTAHISALAHAGSPMVNCGRFGIKAFNNFP